MVSLLPHELRRKHSSQWTLTKLLVITMLTVGLIALPLILRFSSDLRPQWLFSATEVSDSWDSTTTATVQLQPLIAVNHSSAHTSWNAAEATPTNSTSSCPVSVFDSPIPLEHRCEFVQTHKGCQANPFLKLLYCTMPNPAIMWAWFPLCGVCLLFLFYLLGDTVDSYFSPSLFSMSDYFRLSPNVAGVTLLALGNSAPDLSAIMVGTLKGNSDVGIGAPIGAGMFVTCLVFGCVTLLSTVKVTRRPYLRDTIFYLVSVLFMFYLYLDRKIQLWESLLCLGVYFAYVITVFVGRMINQRLKKRRKARKEKKKKKKKRAKSNTRELGDVTDDGDTIQAHDNEVFDEDNISEDGEHDDNSDSEEDDDAGDWTTGWLNESTIISRFGDGDVEIDEEAGGTQEEEEDLVEKIHRQSGVIVPRIGIAPRVKLVSDEKGSPVVIKNYFDKHSTDNEQLSLLGQKDSDSLALNDGEQDYDDGDGYGGYFAKKKRARVLFNMFLRSVEWHERAWYRKVTLILFEGVSIFVRNLTIPKGFKGSWNKWFAACVPVFSPLLLMYTVGGANLLFYLIGGFFPLIIFPLVIGGALSAVILATSKRNHAPIYFPVFVFYAFFMSIVWIYNIAENLVALLGAFGAALGINPGILILTVLAWGNSVGDLVADISIARQGFASMAVGACFGSPLLTLMAGVGISMTAKILLTTNVPGGVDFWCTPVQTEPGIVVIFFFLILTLLASIIVVPIFKFRAPRPYGAVLMIVYAIAVLTSVLAASIPGFGKLFIWPSIGRGC